MNENEIKAITELLVTPKKITIIPHRNPDGDAMGSSLALYHFLLKKNHQVLVMIPNECPDFLEWMPGIENVLVFDNNVKSSTKILSDSDVVFTLDFNALHRTGEEMEVVLKQLSTVFIMIDHHQSPDNYANYTYSDTNFGSTCEMIYNFIEKLDNLNLIDKNIATCIYTGILTDSGGFRFPKTSGRTHRIVADLIDLGAENTQIPALLFDNNSYSRLQLLGCAMNNMKVLEQYKTAYTSLSRADLNQFNYVKGDTEGFVNYGLSIKNIIFAAIFIEDKDEKIIKISFRSQGTFDVNQFSRAHFSGGGHINAAGGKSELSLDETIKKFESIIATINFN